MNNIFKSLRKTRKNISNALSFVSGKKYLKPEEIDQFEELLILSDIDINIVDEILFSIEDKIDAKIDISEFISQKIKDSIPMNFHSNEDHEYRIANIIGVNGAGKTTFCGKVAKFYKDRGFNVCVIAADTYRAAAREQIHSWCKKSNTDIIFNKEKKDPSSVIYEALTSSSSKKYDKIIIDTAGRLQSSSNLMNELAKINNVISKFNEKYENWIALDAVSGQNTISQIENFSRYLPINGIVINKMEGSAKGGFLISILKKNQIPVKFIGTGEKIDDLREFDLELYLNGLLGGDEKN